MAAREIGIQASICDNLATRRCFFFRSNNIPVLDKRHGAFRALPKQMPRGIADIIVVHLAKLYFLDVKLPGTYQRPKQKEFQCRAESAGALYAVVRSIEDVQKPGL